MINKWEAIPDDREVRRKEAAEYLGVKPNTLAIWAIRGTGPAFRRGAGAGRGLCYYTMRDLRNFAKNRPKVGRPKL